MNTYEYSYWKFNLIAVDQLFNTLTGGYPDETLSSRIFRKARIDDGKKRRQILIALRNLIDKLFFFDKEIIDDVVVYHCELSYLSEKKDNHHPAELRDYAKVGRPRKYNKSKEK